MGLSNVIVRIVPRSGQTNLLPQRNDSLDILGRIFTQCVCHA